MRTKNGLGEYLTINLRHFLLIYNPFWQNGDFLDTFGPSRSVCGMRNMYAYPIKRPLRQTVFKKNCVSPDSRTTI